MPIPRTSGWIIKFFSSYLLRFLIIHLFFSQIGDIQRKGLFLIQSTKFSIFLYANFKRFFMLLLLFCSDKNGRISFLITASLFIGLMVDVKPGDGQLVDWSKNFCFEDRLLMERPR